MSLSTGPANHRRLALPLTNNPNSSPNLDTEMLQVHQPFTQTIREVKPAARNDATAIGWIASPTFDLLFLANVGWPLLLIPGIATSSETVVDFWQVYFLTLPHRWITLVLVLIDPDRRQGQGFLLASIVTAAAVVVAGAYFGTGVFLCLGLIDYVWNAWHFGSQHAGVLRIYSRKVGGGFAWMERWGLRVFIFYTILRAAGWTLFDFSADSPWPTFLYYVDLGWLGVPVLLLVTNIIGGNRQRVGKILYLFSVCILYSGYLVCHQFRIPNLILIFATAASMFHAVEYLAVVSHYARRRESVGSASLIRALAPQWLLLLTIFAVALGSVGVWASHSNSQVGIVWQGLNLWAAFSHYAFDGMIWKLRRPETARALVGTE